MAVADESLGRSSPQRPVPTGHARLGWWICAAVSTVLIVLAVGGYAMRWRWTGLSSSVTLWDWLEALALPVALASTPLLLKHRHRLSRTHHLVLAAVLTAFAGFVVAGYLVPISWTGFTGNTLWDWLELMLLPLVIATTSLWPAPTAMNRRHVAAGVAAGVAFAVLVLSGYLVPLAWTGFRGNTAWDWIRLLLVPVLVPTVIVPYVTQRMRERLAPDAHPPREQPGSDPVRPW